MNKEGYERIGSDDDCDYEYEIENEFSQRVSSWANHESEPLLHEPEASKDWIFILTPRLSAWQLRGHTALKSILNRKN